MRRLFLFRFTLRFTVLSPEATTEFVTDLTRLAIRPPTHQNVEDRQHLSFSGHILTSHGYLAGALLSVSPRDRTHTRRTLELVGRSPNTFFGLDVNPSWSSLQAHPFCLLPPAQLPPRSLPRH